MSRLRLRAPSPALVVSVVALIVALGGTSYAAFSLPNGSVGTPQLKNKAVTNAKLGPLSVGNAKIINGAVTASKINPSGLTVPNATAASSLTGVQIVRSGPFPNLAGQQNSGTATCPAGTNVIGGGVFGTGLTTQSMNSSVPLRVNGSSQPNAWFVDENNTSASTNYTFNVYAVCAPVTESSNYTTTLLRK
jgi:hypothetical protein